MNITWYLVLWPITDHRLLQAKSGTLYGVLSSTGSLLLMVLRLQQHQLQRLLHALPVFWVYWRLLLYPTLAEPTSWLPGTGMVLLALMLLLRQQVMGDTHDG